jgi:glycosyltransferase involved in cell wall biosynthesis
VNLGALKILTLGLSSACATLTWCLRNRGRRRVVVSYNLNAPPAYFVGPVCRLLGAKFVPFIGDIYVPGEVVRDTWLRRVEFAAQRRAIPRADGLLVCNKAIVDDFSPTSDFLLVEGGVRESFVASFGVRSRSAPGFHIVFAGQLSDLNGVRLLLDSMGLVDDGELRVTVMGGGPLAHLVEAAAARDPRIRFLGLVPVERVWEEYATADLLVNLRSTAYQTHRYVFPSKVVECLATGVPLLSTKTGHVESEFGEFVFLLDAQTPDALAAKIVEIKSMSVEDRLSIGKSAQQHVLRNKTWEAQVKKIAAYLKERVFDVEAAA